MSIDPVTLTVIWNSFVSIAEEMGTALRRTAFSEAVREGDDFSTGLFDAQARLIAQGNFTPGHLGAMPYVVKAMLDYVPVDTLVPGDMIVTNDSALGGGHFPDFFVMAPVFDDAGKIIFFVVTTAHHMDVGGLYPGSQAVQGITEAYQEGIRVLPVKMVRAGEFDADLLRLLLGNSRLPEKMRGDLMAQRNANHVGATRLRRLHEAYGAATIDAAVEEIIDKSEARARELIGRLKPGTYSFDDCLDDFGPNTDPIHISVDITIDATGATVDFSRSSDQVAAGLNCYLNYTRAYASFALRFFAGIDIPNNHGSEKAIRTIAREGSFFNARYPAASGGRAAVQVRIFDAINGAMAQCAPHRAMGAFSHWSNPNIGGVDPATGKPWILYDLLIAGYGGRAGKDGVEGLSPVFNCANIPVEVHETNTPLRALCLEFIPDSAGAGEFRGGAGLRKDWLLLAPAARVSLLGDRHKFAPYGLFGGAQGTMAETILVRDGVAEPVGSKETRTLHQGDVLSFRLSGAGGFGNPRARVPDAVRADVRDGFISAETAQSMYGLNAADLG